MTAFERNRVVDPVVRLRLFGAIGAWGFSGESVLPRGRKAQAILSYLALSPDGAVPRQRFIDLLWSTRWLEQGRASLRQSIREIRAALGERHEGVISVKRDSIVLNRALVWVDGLSLRADGEPVQSPAGLTFPIERLLEAFDGLDPRFDEWIRRLRGEVAIAFRLTDEARDRSPDVAAPWRQQEGDRNNTDDAAEVPARGLVVSVVPLLHVGSGALEDYVAPAVTQEIVTSLARFRWMQIRLNHSPQQCDANYRLEGYINRTFDDCRLVMRLIDQVDRGIIVWTSTVQAHYPLQYAAISDMVERIVEQLDPEILAIETRKVIRRPSASPDSYECVLRATALLYRFDRESWRRATALLDQAIVVDPQNARAFAYSALCRVTGVAHGWSHDPDRDIQMTGSEAARAVACDPHDSLALALSAHIQSFLHHEFQSALELYARAIRANPSCGISWGYSALTYAYLGQTEEAKRRLARAQETMIHDPFSSFLDGFNAVIAYFSHDWPKAIEICRHHIGLRPHLTNVRKLLIGALCFAGRLEEARLENQRLAQDEPQFTWPGHLATYPFGRSQDRVALKSALLHGGLMVDQPPAFSATIETRPRDREVAAPRLGTAARSKKTLRNS